MVVLFLGIFRRCAVLGQGGDLVVLPVGGGVLGAGVRLHLLVSVVRALVTKKCFEIYCFFLGFVCCVLFIDAFNREYLNKTNLVLSLFPDKKITPNTFVCADFKIKVVSFVS